MSVDWVDSLKAQSLVMSNIRNLYQLKAALVKLSEVLPEEAYEAFVADMDREADTQMKAFVETI